MENFPIPITAMYAGLLGIMLVPISIRVTVLRARTNIMFFDGGDPELGRAIRAQGNFIEYVPMALILLGLLEGLGEPGWALHTLGAGLFVSRLVHAWGMYFHKGSGRTIGTTVTWIMIGVAGLWVLYRSTMA